MHTMPRRARLPLLYRGASSGSVSALLWDDDVEGVWEVSRLTRTIDIGRDDATRLDEHVVARGGDRPGPHRVRVAAVPSDLDVRLVKSSENGIKSGDTEALKTERGVTTSSDLLGWGALQSG